MRLAAIALLCVCALASALAAAEKPTAAKPVSLTYSIFFPATHANTVLATEWAKEIETRTEGRVKITIFAGGTQATELVNAYYKHFTPKEFSAVKIMHLRAHGPGILHTKKPVASLEELKGMKVRCTGLAAKTVEALGGTPVAMPMPETYDALSRGVVDGSMAPAGIARRLALRRIRLR